jgi:hypothetical protein
MDDNNRNVQHPLLVALRIFGVAVRTAFDTAVTLWGLWSGKREKQEAPARQQQSNAPSEQAPQPINRGQATAEQKKPRAPIKRARPRKPLAQGETVDKTPKAPTKRSLKQEQELEREELTQKTERLRKLRLAKEAGDRKKDQP